MSGLSWCSQGMEDLAGDKKVLAFKGAVPFSPRDSTGSGALGRDLRGLEHVTAILPVAPAGRLVHSSQVVDVVDAPTRHAEPIGSRTLRGKTSRAFAGLAPLANS